MNFLLENSPRMGAFTDLRTLFSALGGRQAEFDWVVTDLEVKYLGSPGTLPAPLPLSFTSKGATGEEEVFHIGGEELTRIAGEHPMQVLWGVFSGFRPDRLPDLATLDPIPFADGNPALWKPDVQPQHPLADVEIVCWDSSALLFLSRDPDLSARFHAAFPEAVDLNDYNSAGRAR